MKALAIMLGNALGKVLGLAREVALAYFLGATLAADAFRVSLTAALVPTHFLMGDVLDGAFVPLYSRYLRTNPSSARRLLRLTTAYLAAISLVIAALAWLAGAAIARLFAPGISGETVELASRMVRWMGLGVPFYCFAALYSLYGICHNRFAPLALRSSFQNAALVVAIPIAAWLHDPQWLGLGFALAFVFYLGYTLWALRDVGPPASTAGSGLPEGHELRTLFRTAMPLVFTLVLGQCLTVVDRAAASFAGTGAVASLEYARTFVDTPLVLVGYAVGAVALSRFTAVGRDTVAERAADVVLPLVTAALGLMLLLGVAAPEVVTVAYRRGRFDADAVRLVSQAVRGLAVGAGFWMAVYVMMRIISAQLRNRENIAPMAIGLVVEVLACVALVPRLGLLGVGLSVSCMQVVLCATLATRLGLVRHFVRRLPAWLAGLVAGVATMLLVPDSLESPVLRLCALSLLVLLAWVGALSLFPATRRDLNVLWSQAQTARAKLRPAPAAN